MGLEDMRLESPLRPGDKMQATRQHSPGEGAPHWSIVCRIFDGEGNEHLHIGLVPNPSEWARQIRYSVDNPPVIEEEV